jgi:PAS domain S-box-containing protein
MSTPLLFPSDEHRVVVYEVDLTDIWQRIELAAVGRTGVTYAVSNHGVIIAHPETSYLGRSMPAAVEPVLASYEGFVEYLEPVKKQEVMAAYSPVGGATAWGIVVEQERSEVYATIFRTGFLISSLWLILGVLGTAIIFVLIRNFTKPIKTLTTTVQHIAQTGQLAKTGMRERPDEVGQLSQAFDSMIDKVKDAEGALKQAYDELDTRVQQRTLDLQDAVTRLRQEISQREAAEELVKQSEAKYRELVESASCIILEIDPEGKILFFNKFAEDFFGYKESEVLGRNAIGMLVPDIESSYTNLQQMVRDLVNHPDMYYQSEYENVRRNGEKAWISWTNKGIQNREKKCDRILCFGIDQTEQKRAELLLAQQAEERVAVNERTRLARDLHDAVSQTLFSASIIADVLPRLWEKDAQQGRKRLEEVRQLTRGALAEMRTLLFELRPAALEDAELSYLLRQLGESITGRVRIPVDVQVEGECKLPVEVKVALYRVTQEALNNVSKHAGASIATIRLNCTHGRAALTIADNGRGFDMSKVRAGSLGLGIMQERARGVGANLTVRSQIGQGTVVSVCWGGQEGELDDE